MQGRQHSGLGSLAQPCWLLPYGREQATELATLAQCSMLAKSLLLLALTLALLPGMCGSTARLVGTCCPALLHSMPVGKFQCGMLGAAWTSQESPGVLVQGIHKPCCPMAEGSSHWDSSTGVQVPSRCWAASTTTAASLALGTGCAAGLARWHKTLHHPMAAFVLPGRAGCIPFSGQTHEGSWPWGCGSAPSTRSLASSRAYLPGCTQPAWHVTVAFTPGRGLDGSSSSPSLTLVTSAWAGAGALQGVPSRETINGLSRVLWPLAGPTCPVPLCCQCLWCEMASPLSCRTAVGAAAAAALPARGTEADPQSSQVIPSQHAPGGMALTTHTCTPLLACFGWHPPCMGCCPSSQSSHPCRGSSPPSPR